MARLDYAPLGTLRNADVEAVEQRTGKAFGQDYRYYVASMKDGSEWRLRSVTSVLNALNKEALIQWAVDQAIEDIRANIQFDAMGEATITSRQLDQVLQSARKAHYRVKTEAAELGTTAHNAIEEFLRSGQEQDLAEMDPRVANCYGLFRDWWDSQALSVIQTELMVYDVERGYAGQLDFLAADAQGRPVIVDWKTSKSIYWNYKLQVVAYARALHQMGRGVPSALTIVRIGREDAEFEAVDVPRDDWRHLAEMFHGLIPISDAMREAEAEYRKRTKRSA